MKTACFFIILFTLLSQTAKATQIKAVNKSKYKDLVIIINYQAPQVQKTYLFDTLRAEVEKDIPKEGETPKEIPPKVLRNFFPKKDPPDAIYETKSSYIKPSNLWTAAVFQPNPTGFPTTKVFVANLQQFPDLRALSDKVDLTVEISDDGNLNFIPVCTCPPAITVAATELKKK